MRLTSITTTTILLTALATGAGGHTIGPTTLGGVTPGTIDLTSVGVLGVAACQNLPTVGGSLPLFCGVNGIGVFFDATGINNADAHSHANGNCMVSQGTTVLLGNDFFFACGTDRNDDFLITDQEVCAIEDDTYDHHGVGTNHDECSGETPVTNGGAGENWADDWVEGCWSVSSTAGCPSPSRSKGFCFQDDVAGFTPALTDDTGNHGADITVLNQAGGHWDEFVVFVGVSVPGGYATAGHAGDIYVTLSATGANGCTNGGNVSAHGTPGNTRAGGEASLKRGDCVPGACVAVFLVGFLPYLSA